MNLEGPGPLVVNIIVNYCYRQKMLKETKTDETTVFLSHFHHRWNFNWRGLRPPGPPPFGYAYAPWRRAWVVTSMRRKINFATKVNSKIKNWIYSALRIELTNRTRKEYSKLQRQLSYEVILVEKILSVTWIAMSIICWTCASLQRISFDFVNTNILNARSTFVSKLDEIIAWTWITYHFHKTPRNVLELGRLINFPFGPLREELF